MKARRPPKSLKNIKRPLTDSEKQEMDRRINEFLSGVRDKFEFDKSNPYSIRPDLDFSSNVKEKHIEKNKE